MLSRSGIGTETRYNVVWDDGECRSVWGANVSDAPPPGATVGADGPNAQERAIVAESQGKRPRADAAQRISPPKRPNARAQAIVAESQGRSLSKRARADAEPRRSPPKRARTSTSATVVNSRPCEVRKVGESIWRRFASVRAAGECLALYFPDLISSTVTLYLYHLLANHTSCPCYFRKAFEARYVDESDATAPPVPIAAQVVSTPPSPRESPLAESPMTDIEEAVAPPPCEWPVAAPTVSTPDRATVSPPRESPTRAESELLPVGELILADRSGTNDWAEGSVVTVHADGFYDIQYRTVRTPQRRVVFSDSLEDSVA